jgi:thiamine biosynthesis lipoprotein
MLPSRRDFLVLAAGAFVVATVPLARARRSKLVRRSVPAMGATAEIAVIHRDEKYAFAAADAALAEIQRIDKVMTRFNPGSDIGRANLLAGTSAVPIARESAEVIAQALEWAQATDGSFDPAVAKIMDLWDVAHRSEPPPPTQVARLANRRLHRHVDVDTKQGMIKFDERDVALDLGGIAAGYSVDRAAQVLRDWGVHNGFINVSGDIYALGHAEDGDDWQVGVRSPTDPNALITTVSLSDAAIATSGDYEQFFLYQGRCYHHILDPRTAEPRKTTMRTVTIRADHCVTADAASTAVFGMESGAAARVLSRRPGNARVVV